FVIGIEDTDCVNRREGSLGHIHEFVFAYVAGVISAVAYKNQGLLVEPSFIQLSKAHLERVVQRRPPLRGIRQECRAQQRSIVGERRVLRKSKFYRVV